MGAQALVSWHAALRRSTESGPGAVLQRGPDGSRDAKTWTKAVPSVCGAAVAEPGRFERAVPLQQRLFALWALDRGLKSSKFFESCGFVCAVQLLRLKEHILVNIILGMFVFLVSGSEF
jgi:hypothetical protein